jgi:hypothetical protein
LVDQFSLCLVPIGLLLLKCKVLFSDLSLHSIPNKAPDQAGSCLASGDS